VATLASRQPERKERRAQSAQYDPPAMSESIFLPAGELYLPSEHARGPWDPNALHGGATAALIAAMMERTEPSAQLQFARLSFEFLRPVPMAALSLRCSVTRPGRRVQALSAELQADGVTVCRASALRIVAVPEDLPRFERDAARSLEGPERGREVHFALDDPDRRSFAASAMQMRFLSDAPLPADRRDGERAHLPNGSATVWMRLRHPLLPGQDATPLARLVAAADFGNGVAAALPFEDYIFINADLAITLDRSPQGQWIALQARTLLHPAGVAWAQSVLHDEAGPVGLATQALVVQPR
jgi:Thioesterase-like superfamily